jgi:hypothetical protein
VYAEPLESPHKRVAVDSLGWTTFALSVIGTLAWVPTILEWLRKPEVHIVSAEQIEVSYMEFGGVQRICTLR